MMKNKKNNIPFKKYSYSLPIKMLLLMILALIGPISALLIYDYVRFHEVMFGQGDLFSLIYASSILLSITFVGYIVCEITKEITTPIAALKSKIMSYRVRKDKSVLEDSTKIEEFNYLFREYENLIAEIEQREKELVKKTRLTAIGSVSTMLAHDIRKPLTSILMFLQILPEIRKDPVQVKKLISDIEINVTQTNRMLNDILEFSHEKIRLNLKDHSIKNLIHAAIHQVFHPKLQAEVHFFYELHHGNNNILADDAYIIRVLDNVILNAIEMMPLNAQYEHVGNLFFSSEMISEGSQQYIKLNISDDGSGIPKEILPFLFDPFFSFGKKDGNGLGLAICKNIMEAHEGEIFISNRKDTHGAAVELWFLVGQSAVDEENFYLPHHSKLLKEDYTIEKKKEILSSADKKYHSSFSILLVDDEKVVLDVLHRLLRLVLQDHAIPIKEAGSGEEALELFKKNNFTHIITDIDFGKCRMNGYDFLQLALKKQPKAKVIVHSNKMDSIFNEQLSNTFRNTNIYFKQKPITKEYLESFFLSHHQEEKSLIKGEVLFLNDDASLSLSTKLLFRQQGIHCYTATTADEAWNCFLNCKPAFIVADIHLGENQPSGYDFLEKVRASNPSIPFVIVSGYNKQQEESKALNLGATAYFQTPFKIEELLEFL